MASTQIFKCNKCGAGLTLFQRSKRETMLMQIDGEAMEEKYCLDCYKKSPIERGELDICKFCRGTYMSTEYDLPCYNCKGGRLLTDENSVAMF